MLRSNPRFHQVYFSAAFIVALCLPAASFGQDMLSHFQRLPQTDTLHVEVLLEPDMSIAADTIPNRLFFTEIPQELLQEIDYLADSSEAVVLGRFHFPLNKDVEAYWVEIRQFWFQHHSLLLYDSSRKQFIDRVTLAEWYGGDGGQSLIGSWVFDFDGDGQLDIVRREIQHSMIPDGETVLERTEESAALWLWHGGRFQVTPVSDMTEMVRLFPILTFW